MVDQALIVVASDGSALRAAADFVVRDLVPAPVPPGYSVLQVLE